MWRNRCSSFFLPSSCFRWQHSDHILPWLILSSAGADHQYLFTGEAKHTIHLMQEIIAPLHDNELLALMLVESVWPCFFSLAPRPRGETRALRTNMFVTRRDVCLHTLTFAVMGLWRSSSPLRSLNAWRFFAGSPPSPPFPSLLFLSPRLCFLSTGTETSWVKSRGREEGRPL